METAEPVPPGTARRAVRLFRPHRRQLALVATVTLAVSLLDVVNPLLVRAVFDDGLFAHGGVRLVTLAVLAGLIAVVTVATGALDVVTTFLTDRMGQRMMVGLREDLYRHLQRQSVAFFTARRTGEIHARMSADVDAIRTTVSGTASTALADAATVASAAVALALLSWQLTLASLVCLPVSVWASRRAGQRRQQVVAAVQDSRAELAAITEETLSVSGIMLAKLFGREHDELRRFRAENERLGRLQLRQQLAGQSFVSVVQSLFALMPVIVYVVAGVVAHEHLLVLSPGTLIAFTTLQGRMLFPVNRLLGVAVEARSSLAAFARIFAYLDLPPDIVDAVDARPLPRTQVRGRVSLEGVGVAYRSAADGGSRAAQTPGTSPARPGGLTPTHIVNLMRSRNPAGCQGPVDNPDAAGSGTSSGRRPGRLVADDGTGHPPDRPHGRAPDTLPDQVSDVVSARLPDSPSAVGADRTSASGRGRPRPDRSTHLRWALRDITLDLAPGTFAALVGPSGSGKTTLAYLVARLYDPTEGTVRLDGHDLRRLRMEDVAASVCVVSQETYLFHDTVAANLRYGRPDATDAELVAAARAARIHDTITALPDGYATVVGERGHRLSGGERQRVAIARALLKDPAVLILDEATSALDNVNERLVQAALQPLIRGRTTIAIAHRLSTVAAADVVHVLDDGRIVESGSPAELLRRGGLYARLAADAGAAGVPVG